MGSNGEMLTFGEHLEVLRKMLFRILGVTMVLGVVIFCFKDIVFPLLMAPRSNEFCTYRWIEQLAAAVGIGFKFEAFNIQLINTELSSQFMTHLSTSVYLALLLASPYIVFELFGFIAPALYDSERRYATAMVVAVYVLFILGVLMSYFVLFPVSLRFLGTYQVDASVNNVINLSSYISTFVTLTFLMGLVFQVPMVCFLLAKLGIIDADLLRHYRRHAIVIIAIISAIITPPDIFTLVLVAVPMYGLYELSILIIRNTAPSASAAIETADDEQEDSTTLGD